MRGRFPIVGVLLANAAWGATWYVAPDGGDVDGGGSLAAPWRTVAYAYPRMAPGDKLFLRDGDYGAVQLICGSDGGVSAPPITIAAQNERRASLRGSPNYSLHIDRCSRLVIEGLEVQGADHDAGLGTVLVTSSNDLTFRRILVSKSNRYFNVHLIHLSGSQRITVEDSEFYDFHRDGLSMFQCNDCVGRRNYFHSRGRADLPGAYSSNSPSRGDEAMQIFGGASGVVFENNVSEAQDALIPDLLTCPHLDLSALRVSLPPRRHSGGAIGSRGTPRRPG